MTIDYQVQLIQFPRSTTKEADVLNEDDSYTIFIESSLSREEQRSAFSHAMKHILNCDFQLNDADQIEVNAHDAKGALYASFHCPGSFHFHNLLHI